MPGGEGAWSRVIVIGLFVQVHDCGYCNHCLTLACNNSLDLCFGLSAC